MTPSERTPFLDAILAAPDDDAPRLVYADWLTEKGDPYGEFIAMQCEQARLAGIDEEKQNVRKMTRRENELFVAHEREWTPRVRGRWTFRRGFPEHVEIHGTSLVELGLRLFEAAPTVRSVDVLETGDAERLCASPVLARIEAFSCFGVLARKMPAHIGTAPLSRLRMLAMGGTELGDVALAAMLARPGLGGIQILHLPSATLRAPGAAAIAQSGLKLRQLLLPYNLLGDAGAAVLAGSPQLAGLEVLDVRGNGISTEGSRALRASPLLAKTRIYLGR